MLHLRIGGALEAVGPAARTVVDAGDFDFGAAHTVGDDVGRFGYHEFARAGDPPDLPGFT